MHQIEDSKITGAFQISLYTLLDAKENGGKVTVQVYFWSEVKGNTAVEKKKKMNKKQRSWVNCRPRKSLEDGGVEFHFIISLSQ